MSSSRTAADSAAITSSVLVSRVVDLRVAGPVPEAMVEVFAQVRDPRARRGVRFALAAVLACATAAVLAGARSWVAIAQWATDVQEADPGLLARLGLDRCPSASTFRRLLALIDADELDALLGAYFHQITSSPASQKGRRPIAIDGKTVRGAAGPATRAPVLVAAFDHIHGAVVGQVQIEDGSNEIPAARELLTWMAKAGMLERAVVTMDALHTQTETAEVITAAGADYALTVKGNQPTHFNACKHLPWKHIRAHSYLETSHGRRIHRAVKVTTPGDGLLTFPGAVQIAQVRRTVTKPDPKHPRKTKKTIEIVYVITTAGHLTAPPATIADWVQGHWSIENRLHWVRDVTFDEDRSQIRAGNGPRVMATIRSAAISLHRIASKATNIAAALRHHAMNPGKVVQLLTRPITTLA